VIIPNSKRSADLKTEFLCRPACAVHGNKRLAFNRKGRHQFLSSACSSRALASPVGFLRAPKYSSARHIRIAEKRIQQAELMEKENEESQKG
jgi:hypothetical protein